MKYAFSTLGCPDWSFDEIISTAKDIGFDGVELRGIGRELYMPNAQQFLPGKIDKTMDKLKKMKLEISCLSSDCRLNERFKIDDHIKSAKEYIDLASAAGIKNVRILADTSPAPVGVIDKAAIAKDLQHLAEYAKQRNVTVMIETNGFFANSEEMLDLLASVNHENLAVLWDIHHPFRFFNEPVKLTYERLKKYIRYVHIKDSLMNGDAVQYQMMGYGDVPILEALALLRADNFEGYVTLEWLKRWQSDLAEAGVVFPHFLAYVKG